LFLLCIENIKSWRQTLTKNDTTKKVDRISHSFHTHDIFGVVNDNCGKMFALIVESRCCSCSMREQYD